MASKEPAAEENGGCNTETEEETIALQRKRSRRVSFAETTAIHLFTRDDEYETPPDDAGNPSSEDEDKLRRSESDEIMELLQSSDDDDDDGNVGAVKSSFLRPMESPSPGCGFGSATSNDEDNFFGPVSMDFIRPGRLSDSAASDENHDITMDSTAFSMHFRSLAKSDSGGDFKTPTGIRLAFDERTSGQISTANSLGDLMDLTMGRKPVSHSSFPADKVNDSGYSDEMSVVSENSLRYDYAKLPPELDVLLAEGSKDVGAVSLNGQVSSLKKVTVSELDKNRHELLDIAHIKDADITLVPGVEKSSGEAISTADMNFNEKIDDVTPASVLMGEAPYNKSDNLDVDPVTVLPIHDQGTPFDEEGKSRKLFIEASGIFESPSSRTLSNLNHEQPTRSFVAGSVSSLLAKRRKIFKASTNQSNDEWNLILLAKEFSDKGSIKHVWSTSRFAKGVSRLRRLENFPYASTSKAEGAISKLFPPSQFPISTSKNIFLGNSNSCNTVENCVDVPVVCLEARFSDVATDKGDFKSTMDNNVLNLVGNKEFARDTVEVKDVSLSSFFTGMPFPEKSRKVVNASNTHSFPGSQMNRLDHHILKDNNAKATQQLMGSDSILPDVTFDKDNTKTGMSNNYDFSSKIWMSDNSVFSSNKGLEKLASSQYQEKLSINLIQPCQSHLRLDRDVGQKEEVVYASRTEDATSSLSDRKEKNNVLSSDFEHPNCVAQEKRCENLLLSNQSGLATSMCFQTVLDKDSESCELYSLTDDVQTGRMLTSKAQLAQSVESIAGSSEGFDGSNKLPTQRPPESPELSFSLLHKEPCAMIDDEHMHLVREDAPTPTPNKLTSKYDKDDSLSKTQSYVWAIDSSSGRKRKLGGVVDGTERHNGGVLSFQPKLQLYKDQNHLQVGSEVSCSVGVTAKLRRWDDVFSSLCGMTKQLLSPSIDKHALALVEKLDDILVHLEKVKSYEHLYQNICSQKSSDPANYLQNKRVLDFKSLLNKILYKKANLQLLHLKRGRLLGQIQQLNAKIQDSETLTSNFFCPRVFAQKDTRAANIHTESHPKDIEDTSLAPVELSQLKAELEVSGRKMKNLRDSFYAYFKVIEEPTGTNITEYAKDFLVKRVSCRSMLSELQLLEIESLKMQNGRQNFIFNHCGFLFQSVSLNLSSTSALSISMELNNLKISKMFYNMDACTAFSFVFGSERILMYSGVRTIAQETQKTNSVLQTLLDVVEEVELAMMELTNLTHSRFSQPSAGRLDLQLCFTDFKSGARVNLSIDVTCLNRGVYPSETMRYEVQGRAARNDNSLEILLSNIRTGFKGLRCGYMRIINLCRCVSKMMQNSQDMT